MLNFFKPRIRTRFAPSPTGYLHIGSLRTALYAYLYAKQRGGTFFLRIEDTDQSREIAGAVDNLIKTLKWANIVPDEGVIGQEGGKAREKGNFGPYTQSQRLEIYRNHAQILLEKNHAYHCFCSPEHLEKLRHDQEAAKLPTRYDGHCRNLSDEEVKTRLAKGEKPVIRMKIPQDRIIEFNDLIRGSVKVHGREIDDQVIMKADGFPTYHLAHVVDDHLMKTTHIIRGEEWLPSTPKHLLLFEYFGWPAPQYAHLSLILNPDKTKLSKRQGDVAVEDYRDKGYLPQALINYISLLGWNPGTEQEKFSLPELIKVFDLKNVHKAGAVFDVKKLDWLNGEYIKQLSLKEFSERAKSYLEKNIGILPSDLDLEKIMSLEQERVSKLGEVGEGIKFLFQENLDYDADLLIWKKSDRNGTIKALELIKAELEKYADWSKTNLEKSLIDFIKSQGLTNGEVLWPLRVALTGQEKSPTPFEIAEILGREKTINRIESAISRLKK